MKFLAFVLLVAVAATAGTIGIFILGFAHPSMPGRATWGQAMSWSAVPFAVWVAAAYALVELLLPKVAGRGVRNLAMAVFVAVPILAAVRDLVFVTRGDQELFFVPIMLFGTIGAALVAGAIASIVGR